MTCQSTVDLGAAAMSEALGEVVNAIPHAGSGSWVRSPANRAIDSHRVVME